jgi:adenine nucleotide transporter 17
MGITASDTLSTLIKDFLYFFLYSDLRARLHARKRRRSGDPKKDPVLSAAEELAIGALAGAISRFFTTPFSCITVRKQTWENESDGGAAMEREKGKGADRAQTGTTTTTTSSSSRGGSPGLLTVAKGIYDEGGVTGFWNGFQSACLLVRIRGIDFLCDWG